MAKFGKKRRRQIERCVAQILAAHRDLYMKDPGAALAALLTSVAARLLLMPKEMQENSLSTIRKMITMVPVPAEDETRH